MSSTGTAVRKTVLVDARPSLAFELFTEGIASWWPTETHSRGGSDVTDIVFEGKPGGRVFEVTDAGEHDWDRVLEWEPPRHFRLELLTGDARGSTVLVAFTPEGARTRIDFVHDGLDAGASRERYARSWDVVLTAYAKALRE